MLKYRSFVSGRDALIKWSDGSESYRVASTEHLTNISNQLSSHSERHEDQSPRIKSDIADLKSYFSPRQAVIVTTARCRRILDGVRAEIAVSRVGTIIRWTDDEVHVVIQWNKVGGYCPPRRVLTSKDEILRISVSHVFEHEILHRLIKLSRQQNGYTWTTWKIDIGFLAANNEDGAHTNDKGFDTAQEVHVLISFSRT